jgi:hypothetical protein
MAGRKTLRNAFAAASVSGLFMAGCGEQVPAHTTPSIGIVVDKDTRAVAGQCLFSHNGVCMVYDEVTVYDVSVGACRRETDGVTSVDEGYLEQHQRFPSDYPVLTEGAGTQEDGQTISCRTTFEVDSTVYDAIAIGQIVTAAELS